MELDVLQQDGTSTGRTVALDASVFGIEPNDHVVWLDVRRIQAHQRQGTHKAKERSEVRGSTRKLYRQKGTGNARVGDAKSPIRRGGGRAFGPRPRQYGLDLNRKEKRLARRSVLSDRAQNGGVRVVEDFSMDAPSTRQLRDLVGALDLSGRKVLLVTGQHAPTIYRSSTNLKKVHVQEARNLNTVELLDHEVIVFQESALEQLTDLLGLAEAQAA
jgi:large subunit ribosomal protein L4